LAVAIVLEAKRTFQHGRAADICHFLQERAAGGGAREARVVVSSPGCETRRATRPITSDELHE
jgi:hypothetical protein